MIFFLITYLLFISLIYPAGKIKYAVQFPKPQDFTTDHLIFVLVSKHNRHGIYPFISLGGKLLLSPWKIKGTDAKKQNRSPPSHRLGEAVPSPQHHGGVGPCHEGVGVSDWQLRCGKSTLTLTGWKQPGWQEPHSNRWVRFERILIEDSSLAGHFAPMC